MFQVQTQDPGLCIADTAWVQGCPLVPRALRGERNALMWISHAYFGTLSGL
jgi:hypothetical protein